MDKMLTIIIIFISMSILMAAILVMGAVPKIFQTGQQVNQTQATLNQTQMFIQEQAARDKQTRHEDQARFNQTQHEDNARDKQANKIVNTVKEDLNRLKNEFFQFVSESEKRSEQANTQRDKLQKDMSLALIQNQNITDEILNISNQHKQVAKDHDKIQTDVANQTKQTYDLLKTADAENSQLRVEMARPCSPSRVATSRVENS